MMRSTGPTFWPPAPTAGPVSILDLPPDDWNAEAKLNGARVLVTPDGDVWTRYGTPITKPKGLDLIRGATRGLPMLIDAEWCLQLKTLFIFDMPNHDGIYDDRIAEIPAVIQAVGALSSDGVSVQPIPRAMGPFRESFEFWQACGYEGIVVKKRRSLYSRMPRANMATRDWAKFRFEWLRSYTAKATERECALAK